MIRQCSVSDETQNRCSCRIKPRQFMSIQLLTCLVHYRIYKCSAVYDIRIIILVQETESQQYKGGVTCYMFCSIGNQHEVTAYQFIVLCNAEVRGGEMKSSEVSESHAVSGIKVQFLLAPNILQVQGHKFTLYSSLLPCRPI